MTLLDLILQILQAHGQSLQILKHQFGHQPLLERISLLNLKLELQHPSFNLCAALRVLPELSKKTVNPQTDQPDPFTTIDATVLKYCPHRDFEFHLWSYPLYRSLIEADHDLHLPIECSKKLASAIQSGAELWLSSLIHSSISGEKSWEPWERLILGLGQITSSD